MNGRRSALIGLGSSIGVAVLATVGRAFSSRQPGGSPAPDTSGAARPRMAGGKIHYLEIVTPEVEATCAAQAKLHGLSFGEPVAMLGNARTAALPDGGTMAVRAPLRETESPVVRPYVLVEDIEAAVRDAAAAGAEIAHPPMELPGHGQFAIYIQGGIQHGLWQL